MATDLTDGRPWILLPGTLCTGEIFDGFLDALDVPVHARHVVRLRYPKVEDYLEELQRASEVRAVICGFSLGAIVAAHLADRLTVSHFFLFGLNPHADDPAKFEGREALASEVRQSGGAAALSSRLPPLAGLDPEQSRAFVLAMADKSAHDINAQTTLALDRPGALGALARTDVPVTLLTGANDNQAPLALAEEAARVAPRGRVVPLLGLGHYALVEDAEVCCRAVDVV